MQKFTFDILCLFVLAGLYSERRHPERTEGDWDEYERVAEKRSRAGKTTQTMWRGSVQKHTHTLKTSHILQLIK